ncbi:hypothetical protein C4J97_2011 [Pseudomonas orientalis]|nr:hypothetical protein C4J97_2011 [Pseudomonas orientalis]
MINARAYSDHGGLFTLLHRSLPIARIEVPRDAGAGHLIPGSH